VTKLIAPVFESNGLPGAAAALVCGGADVGKEVVGSRDVDLGESNVGDYVDLYSELYRLGEDWQRGRQGGNGQVWQGGSHARVTAHASHSSSSEATTP
jgi:hypothetical protein